MLSPNRICNCYHKIFFSYSAADNYVPFFNKKISIVHYDGKVNWASPVIFKSHCNIDVTQFPFDKQSCQLKFGPWQYDVSEVNLSGTGLFFK